MIYISSFIWFVLPLSVNENAKDYLSAGEVLMFKGQRFQLKSSAHPTDDRYKQAYFRPDEDPGDFNQKLLLEAIKEDMTAKKAIKLEIQTLQKLKIQNHLVSYRLHKKGGKYIIGYVENNGKIYDVYKWNLYRYQAQVHDEDSCTVRFGYTYRDSLTSKQQIEAFFQRIESKRSKLVKSVKNFDLPRIQIKD